MKTLRLHSAQHFELHDEPKPVPVGSELLLKVTAVGICGSDLHWFSEAGIGDDRLERPLVLGHEFAGVIIEGPRKGERVAVDPAINCNNCLYCHEGHPNLCLNLRFAGHSVNDGAMREYMAWPEQCLHPIPNSLNDADGAMLEPLGVAIHAVDLAHVKTGTTVGVFGCGPIGLLIIQVARAAGATRIVATDKLYHRVEAAKAFGAAESCLAANGQELELIWRATDGLGVDVAFEAAGENEAIDTAVSASKRGGKVILAGIPAEDRSSFSASNARRKGLTFKLVRRMKHTYPRAIRLVESGAVDIRSLVTQQFSLDEYAQAFTAAAQRQGLKTVIVP